MSIRLLSAFIALLSLFSALHAQSPQLPQAPQSPSPFTGITIVEETLPNGLTLILSPDKRLPVVAVEMRYLVGSGHEVEGRSGFAHLFEHLMFQGSKNFDKEYFEPFTAIGGEVNGTTDTDRTNYYEQVPSNALEIALWMESDRMEGLLEALTQEKLDNQRDVVKNERRQRYENSPYGMAWKVLYEELYPVHHPYHHSTIGSHEDLTAATLDDVKAFFKRYYVPANAVLTISGDFDIDEARALAFKYFGHLSSGQRASRPQSILDFPTTSRFVEIEDQQIKLPRIYLAWLSPALYEVGDAALDIWATILTNGKNSRLYKPLVYEQKIFKDISAFQASSALSSMFIIQATLNPDQNIESATKALSDAVNQSVSVELTDEEFSKALNAWRKSFYGRVEGVLSRAQLLSNYYHFVGRANYLNEDLERYLSLNPQEVFQTARQYLIPSQALQLNIVLQGQSQKSKADRSKLPTMGQPKTWQPPKPKTWTMANGLNIWFLEQQQAPLINMQLILEPGSSCDQIPGLTAITVDLLDEGVKGLDALGLSDAFQKLATDYHAETSIDHISFSLDMLSEQIKPSLQLLSDILQQPNLKEEDFNRIKALRLAQSMSNEGNPRFVRDMLMRKVLFQNGYASYPNDGKQNTISQITLDQVKSHYQQLIKPKGATLVVVGKITEDQLKSVLNDTLSSWTGEAQVQTQPITISPFDQGKIHWVDFPGNTQSAVSMVRVIDKPSSLDIENANALFNQVFGGEFSSRLNMNLRESKGYTYGAYSAIVLWKKLGLFMMSAMVKADTTKASIEEMISELKQIKESKKISVEELETMRGGAVKNFPARFESLDSIVAEFSGLKIQGKEANAFDQWVSSIEKIGIDMVQNQANAMIDLKQMQIFVVGDYEKLHPAFKELKMEIIKYDAQGNVKNEEIKK